MFFLRCARILSLEIQMGCAECLYERLCVMIFSNIVQSLKTKFQLFLNDKIRTSFTGIKTFLNLYIYEQYIWYKWDAFLPDNKY